ncbi:MAG TPA: GNAT family N-acetyltransferase [Dehalococcoidia bacterium]|nr:GNAT family N-acetyltransferase [Dehalococcoidia bacterium]
MNRRGASAAARWDVLAEGLYCRSGLRTAPEGATGLNIHTFTKSDIPEAAELLAARHLAARKTHSFLPAEWDQPERWQETLTAALEGASGVVATDGGRTLGFMLGRRDLTDQRSMGARYGDPRAGFVPFEGHAVAAGADARRLYTVMYAELGAEWVRRGFFSHGIQVFASDRAARDAMVDLGFGHKFVAAFRPAGDPPPAAEAAGLEVREASRADEEDVHRLEMELDYYHATPPMFMPVDAETEAGARRMQETLYDNPEAAIFLAYREGRAVGMVSMMAPSYMAASLLFPGLVYLYQGIVSEEARSSGAGEVLLARALRWAAERGHTHVALHYHAANPTGGPFWRKHGFEAVQQGMARLVDERIAWARDWR